MQDLLVNQSGIHVTLSIVLVPTYSQFRQRRHGEVEWLIGRVSVREFEDPSGVVRGDVVGWLSPRRKAILFNWIQLNCHSKSQLWWEPRMAQDKEAGGLSSVLLSS